MQTESKSHPVGAVAGLVFIMNRPLEGRDDGNEATASTPGANACAALHHVLCRNHAVYGNAL